MPDADRSRARSRVLIADDEPGMRSLLRLTLGSDRFEVVEAADGVTAVAAALAEPPDVVLLDWHMPGRSGLEVCKALRENAATAGARIVMLTARGTSLDRAAGMAAGADGFMAKPFSPLALLDRIEELLREGRRER